MGIYRSSGKRMLDLFIVVVLFPLWIPVTLAVALLVRLRLGRPVIFRQVRPGLGGEPFTLYKFRSMTISDDAHGSPLPDEARMTRVGSFLRRSSLDELPEVFNVLRGEMSLVGPRPLLLEYVPRYTTEQARRHEVKPGITGWAQVTGRNEVEWAERFARDVWYVDSLSPGLDLRILAKTFGAVFSRRGINQPGEGTMKRFEG